MNVKSIFASVAALLIGGSFATAATIVQSGTYSGTPSYEQTLTFNKFNTNLGTLNSIKFELSLVSTGGQVSVDNEQAGPTSGTVTFIMSADLSSTDVALVGPGLAFPPFGTLEATATSGLINVAGDNEAGGAGPDYVGTDSDVFNTGGISNSYTKFVNSAVFGGYSTAGAGTYDIKVAGAQSSNASFVGGIFASLAPASSGGLLTITYDYNTAEVPEPGAIVMSTMLLTGICGVGVWRKRKQA